MASISHDKKTGRRTIQFKDTDGSRKSIRLGKCDKKSAEAIRTQVEHLASARANGTAIPEQASAWLRTIDEGLRARIASTGLVEERKSAILGEYLASYIKRRVDAKPGTVLKWQATEKQLTKFFSNGRDLRTITAGDADAFRLHLLASKTKRGIMQTNTISKHIRVARLFFNAAVRDEVVVKNPFSGVDSGDRRNSAREYFVTQAEADACIEAAPDLQWRLIIALARYGGLRTPSELVRLKWTDILWDSDRMVIHSPKTEGYEGKETRIVPLFPELKPFLDAAWVTEADKSEFVITRYRTDTQNLRTTFLKIIERAALKPWPKLFQNMRASRQTELEETFPSHVVCRWMGNSVKVAQKHYLQVTEEHYGKAVQNPVQQASARTRIASLSTSDDPSESPENADSQRLKRNKINPTRARTWNDRTKICCVTITPSGYFYYHLAKRLVVAESDSDFTKLQSNFIQRCNPEITT